MTATMQGTGTTRLPMTERQMTTLHQQRNELKDQLKALNTRRNQLDEQARVLGPDASRDHQLRIKEIDARTADIDRQLMRLDIEIARGLSQPLIIESPNAGAAEQAAQDALRAAQQAIASVPPPPPPAFQSPADRLEMVASVGLLLVGAATVVWIAARRFFAKKNPQSLEGQARRLDQLQQSIDVIAIEVERMSESQRFVAKVLNEKFPALGVGSAMPVATKAKDASKV
jgi:hypothetical protein